VHGFKKLAAILLAAAACSGGWTAPAPAQAVARASARWSGDDVAALIREAERSSGEGIRAGRYDIAGLRGEAEATAPGLDALADRIALSLAHDYAEGSTTAAARAGWGIPRDRIDYTAWLAGALARHDMEGSLRALLPTEGAYAALRDALGHCDTPPHCLTIRVNMERWRWLPRELGTNHILVNPATFRLDLVEQGIVISTHRVIVGKPASPTPTFATQVTGVTANPWWNVPQSIVAESVGALVRARPAEAAERGYVAARGADGRLQVRQRPGPRNALGLVKLEMPNAHSVFIHDTPSRDLFEQDRRALSHGCVRTARPDILAKILLPPDGAAEFDSLMASGVNRTLPLATPVPAYIVYFTAEPDPEAEGGVRFFEDLYRRDGRVAAAL
jgi:murein L,D-transpeptidase YcbB/YkuD